MPQQTDPASPSPVAYAGARYAFPFYELTPSEAGAPTAVADRRINDWKKAQLGPTPAPRNNGAIDLAEIIGPEGVSEIEELGEDPLSRPRRQRRRSRLRGRTNSRRNGDGF